MDRNVVATVLFMVSIVMNLGVILFVSDHTLDDHRRRQRLVMGANTFRSIAAILLLYSILEAL